MSQQFFIPFAPVFQDVLTTLKQKKRICKLFFPHEGFLQIPLQRGYYSWAAIVKIFFQRLTLLGREGIDAFSSVLTAYPSKTWLKASSSLH